MKKKLKFFALVMLVVVGLVTSSNIYAAQPFQNHAGVTEENADFVVSYTADKTNLQKGEEFTVTINVDKMPSNKQGIVALSNRIAYDSRVVEVVSTIKTEDIYDDDGNYIDTETIVIPEIIPGDVGTGLGLRKGNGGIISFSNEPEYIKAVCFNSANTFMNPKEPGVYATVKFRAKTDATESDAKLMLLQDGVTYNGFAIAGKKYTTQGWVTNPSNTFFIKSNLSDVNVSVNP